MDIEVIHRIKIFYEMEESEQTDRVESKAFEWGYKFNDVELESSAGGPCWGPYFILESENKQSAVKLATRIENYILKFKGSKIL